MHYLNSMIDVLEITSFIIKIVVIVIILKYYINFFLYFLRLKIFSKILLLNKQQKLLNITILLKMYLTTRILQKNTQAVFAGEENQMACSLLNETITLVKQLDNY